MYQLSFSVLLTGFKLLVSSSFSSPPSSGELIALNRFSSSGENYATKQLNFPHHDSLDLAILLLTAGVPGETGENYRTRPSTKMKPP